MALTDNLISFWELGEASGTRNDSHGTNHLTDNNTVTQTTGKVGNCAQLTLANSEYLSVADNSSLSVTSTDSWTFCAWVYADSLPTFMMVASKSGSSSSNIAWDLFYYNDGSVWTFAVSTDAGASYTNNVQVSQSISTATWYFVVWWFDFATSTIKLQVNDGTPGSASSTAPADSSSDLRIGARYSTAELFWNGRIDQVGFWKRILDSTERSTLYNSGNGVSYADISGGGGGGGVLAMMMQNEG